MGRRYKDNMLHINKGVMSGVILVWIRIKTKESPDSLECLEKVPTFYTYFL